MFFLVKFSFRTIFVILLFLQNHIGVIYNMVKGNICLFVKFKKVRIFGYNLRKFGKFEAKIWQMFHPQKFAENTTLSFFSIKREKKLGKWWEINVGGCGVLFYLFSFFFRLHPFLTLDEELILISIPVVE